MRHIAVIGSGPAGYYTAEACQRLWGDVVRVDIIDRLPVPFGLIRSGVAPDHQSIKGVSRRYEAVALTDNIRFVGNVTIGRDVSIEELRGLYDAVVLATGAPHDRKLDIAGAELPGVVGSAALVGWYNGHPDYAELAPPLAGPGAVIIGHGNVALDVARVLAKAQQEFAGSDIVAHALAALDAATIDTITLLGRRGPHQIAMTTKEVAELNDLARAAPVIDPADLPPIEDDAQLDTGHRKVMAQLRAYAARGDSPKPIRIVFDFYAMPVAIEGGDRVQGVRVERTRLDEDGHAVGTGETYTIPASLVVSCVGYRTPPIEGVPYDDSAGRFANDEGRVGPGLYAVGWARRGPTGTIGTNRPDGYAIVEKIAADIGEGGGKSGRPALDSLLAERGVDVVTFRDWQKIETAEVAAARADAPREKFTTVEAMLAAREG
ncbi:FAD-dependent oxidoreductase [Sphingomonas sp. MMS12-HWE2-04]|uniref:FAD-dependent oxidoreductase n=1 Tax=Sphingomonas sp. MMS12-HWE2-04 TaxID=3234199 RepID=UPI00384C23F9